MRRTGRVTLETSNTCRGGPTLRRRVGTLHLHRMSHRALWRQLGPGRPSPRPRAWSAPRRFRSNESFARRALRTASGSRSRNPAFRRRSSTPGRARKSGSTKVAPSISMSVLLAQEDDVLVGQRPQSVGGRDDLGLVDVLEPRVTADDLEGVLRGDGSSPSAHSRSQESSPRFGMSSSARFASLLLPPTSSSRRAAVNRSAKARDPCRRRVAPP